MQSAITHLIAGVPVSDLDAGIDWYSRFFGRPPDLRAGEEILWDVDEHATLFIEPDAARAGSLALPRKRRAVHAECPRARFRGSALTTAPHR
jgi:hypothetical protein